MVSSFLLISLLATMSAVASTVLPSCVSDLDCSLNGVCDRATGKCACDAPWTGGSTQPGVLPDCSLLSFRPSPVSECGPGCVFHGVNSNWTSWGVSVSPSSTGVVGYAAEMAFECGLSAWTKGSQVVRVVGSSAIGPFTRTDIVVPAWSHNPDAIHSIDGKTVIFTLGDGWEQNGQPDD